MKYPVAAYARAFAEVAAKDIPAAEADRIVKRFVAVVTANGDGGAMRKILAAADKMLRERTGVHKMTVETARPLKGPLRDSVRALAGKGDVIEEKINPELVAGIRVIVDEERQFDASFARKLHQMFK